MENVHCCLEPIADPGGRSSVDREKFLKAFKYMVLGRVLDEKLASLYRAGKIYGGCYLGRGQEALSVAIGLNLKKGDVFAPLIRDTAGRLAFGEPIHDAVRTYLGSVLGPMRGRDGNVHRGRIHEGIIPMISHLGAMIAVVNGILFARKLKGITGTVGVASIGDGGTSTGAFHEALNQASVEKLPLVVVVANNQYAYSTPNSRQFACRSLADRAIGYGISGYEINGTDLESCLDVLKQTIEEARLTSTPKLVVANLLRLCGHGEHDDASYIDPKIKDSPIGRDCIRIAEERLLQRGWASQQEITMIWEEAKVTVDRVVAEVQSEPAPDPYAEDWCALKTKHLADIYCIPEVPDRPEGVLDLP